MTYDLPAMAKRAGKRRNTTLRPIFTTQAQAQDLARLYLDVMNVWRDAKEQILAGYTPQTLDSPQDNRQAIEATADQASRLVMLFGARVRQWSLRMERWHRAKWAGAVLAATSIDPTLMMQATTVQETLDAFLERNVALVKDISAQAQSRISDAVFRGYQNRTPARDLAKEIDEAVKLGRKRAVRVAADQVSKLSAALDDERMAEAGLELFRWRHSGKAHPRPEHKARDGRIYDLKTGKQVNPDGSKMAGGETVEASDRPGRPPWCGCRAQAYLMIEAEL